MSPGMIHCSVASMTCTWSGSSIRTMCRESPDTPNAVALDDDGVVARGRTSRAIDQGPVLNNERFSVTAVHRSLLSEQRCVRSRLHAGVPRVQHPITPTGHPEFHGCGPPRLDRAMLCPRVSHSKRVG